MIQQSHWDHIENYITLEIERFFQLKYECDIWLCKNCCFYVKNTSQRNILWQNCKVPMALYILNHADSPKTSCNLSHAKTSIGQPAVACTPQDHGDLPKFGWLCQVSCCHLWPPGLVNDLLWLFQSSGVASNAVLLDQHSTGRNSF